MRGSGIQVQRASATCPPMKCSHPGHTRHLAFSLGLLSGGDPGSMVLYVIPSIQFTLYSPSFSNEGVILSRHAGRDGGVETCHTWVPSASWRIRRDDRQRRDDSGANEAIPNQTHRTIPVGDYPQRVTALTFHMIVTILPIVLYTEAKAAEDKVQMGCRGRR